jgi:hypothetical protein
LNAAELKIMRPKISFIGYLSIAPLLIGLIFFSNIKGYFRFISICAQEGGLRVYEPLEKNVGWWAKDKYQARAAALLAGVGFVRYTDKADNITYDIRFLGGNPQKDSSFIKSPADTSKLLTYQWRYINGRLENELRLGRQGYEILDISDDRVLVRFYIFGYSILDRDHTPLETRASVGCFDEKSFKFDEPDRWRKELNTAFKN